MNEVTEKRQDLRHEHKSPVMIQNPDSRADYRGRMINFSNHGLFVETGADFETGAKILIGIENSPFRVSTYDNPDGYIAQIMWRLNMQDTFYSNGYGVKLISNHKLQNAKTGKVQTDQEMRRHPRKPYHKPVYFTSQNQYFSGTIDNISRGGAFIEAKGSFRVEQVIRLVVPGTKIDHGTMLKSEVVHTSAAGVGVKFRRLLRNTHSGGSTDRRAI
jgi:Tfp pilus assembly protein PilZ